MSGKKILVVDDVPEVRDLLVDALRGEYDVQGVSNAAEALECLKREAFDLLITDIAMPEMTGEELVGEINKMSLNMEIIAITAYGSIQKATKLMRMGVYDYMEKPFAIDKIKHAVEQAFKFSELKKENRILHTQVKEYENLKVFVGRSGVIESIREKIRLVAPTKATILITGESGTGKELVAKEVHALSRRSDKVFVKINCASIPETLLESELFGHEKGAFTGAIRAVPGKFEMANSGTILLDEIGEMSATIQAKLLRVIQEGEFDRVGGTKPIRVDVRIIATTNRNLRKEINRGNFREDLFYRLNVVPLEIAPLRERREDIPMLIQHFMHQFARENKKEQIKISKAGMQKLYNANWRGNVRELENVIERATILANGSTLDAPFFNFENDADEHQSNLKKTFQQGSIREMEKLMILSRLTDHAQNRTRAANSLDISVRTLRNKLNEYQIHRDPREKSSGGISVPV